MRVWRLCRRSFAKQPLSGEGGLHASGRWHSAPRLVVYASQSLALASLELLVHVDVDLVPRDLVAIELDVPSPIHVAEFKVSELPRGWRRYPAPASLQKLGEEWLDCRQDAVLCVPSAIIPGERNYVINPKHPDILQIRVLGKTPFSFDPRLVAKRRG
ncbi:MAG: RES family NAD+ phosphorylase [Planctomycetales bacterium]